MNSSREPSSGSNFLDDREESPDSYLMQRLSTIKEMNQSAEKESEPERLDADFLALKKKLFLKSLHPAEEVLGTSQLVHSIAQDMDIHHNGILYLKELDMIVKAVDTSLRKALSEFLLGYVRQTSRITLSFEGLEKNLQKAVGLRKYGLDVALANYKARLEKKTASEKEQSPIRPATSTSRRPNVSEVYHKLLKEREKTLVAKKPTLRTKVRRTVTAGQILSGPSSPTSAIVPPPPPHKGGGSVKPANLPTKQPSQKSMCQTKKKRLARLLSQDICCKPSASQNNMFKDFRIEVVPAERKQPPIIKIKAGLGEGARLKRSESTSKAGPEKKVSLHDSLTDAQLSGALSATHRCSVTICDPSESMMKGKRESAGDLTRPTSASKKRPPSGCSRTILGRRVWK